MKPRTKRVTSVALVAGGVRRYSASGVGRHSNNANFSTIPETDDLCNVNKEFNWLISTHPSTPERHSPQIQPKKHPPGTPKPRLVRSVRSIKFRHHSTTGYRMQREFVACTSSYLCKVHTNFYFLRILLYLQLLLVRVLYSTHGHIYVVMA